MKETPWIEILNLTNSDELASGANRPHPFHAVFALQVSLPTTDEQMNFRRGFNLGAYLDENIDRQRVFIESQRLVEMKNIMEAQEKRTLAIRCINKLEEGLLISVIGKTIGISEDDAKKRALAYCREIISLFPYDYKLHPATSQEDFHYLVGFDILKHENNVENVVKIKRYEIPIVSLGEDEMVSGIWVGRHAANEMIWRALGGVPYNVFLNITLRPTNITDNEKQTLKLIKQKTSKLLSEQSNPTQASIYGQWIEPYINRRLSTGRKFFVLQVHLVGAQEISDDLIRAVGTAFTMDNRDDKPSPGFDIQNPVDTEESLQWKKKIYALEIIRSQKEAQTSRLSDIADIDEVFSVCRFPLPPSIGFPGIRFLRKEDVKNTGMNSI